MAVRPLVCPPRTGRLWVGKLPFQRAQEPIAIVPVVVDASWASHGVAVPAAQIFTLDDEGKIDKLFSVDAAHVTASAVQAPVNMAIEDEFKILLGEWEMVTKVGEEVAEGDFLLVPEATGGPAGTGAMGNGYYTNGNYPTITPQPGYYASGMGGMTYVAPRVLGNEGGVGIIVWPIL